MAYLLKPKESIPKGLRRVARKQLRSAVEQLQTAAVSHPEPGRGEARDNTPVDNAIHEARKSVKKVRAVMQLIRADDGTGLSDSRKRLRRANRILSKLRDADAMSKILMQLQQRHRRLFSEHTFARLRSQLLDHKQLAERAATMSGALEQAVRYLNDLERDAKNWRPSHRRFAALGNGIEDSYRKGRACLARAKRRQRATDYHEWRKEMKALWYKLRLIEGCSAALRKDVRALHHAESSLGDEHNLAVLCGYLLSAPALLPDPADFRRLQLAARRYQRELRARAIASAGRIYATTPAAYRRRVKRWWKDGKERRAVRPPLTGNRKTPRRRSIDGRHAQASEALPA